MIASTVDESAVLAAARAGDGEAFRTLVEPHLSAIQVHCYRMLGSFHDAQEAVQETLLRAWRGLDTYEQRAPLRHWLYRIATTTCLKARAARSRQPATIEELSHLQPYPDRLLDELPTGADPAAEVERRESVSLAFVAALQLLPATQSGPSGSGRSWPGSYTHGTGGTSPGWPSCSGRM